MIVAAALRADIVAQVLQCITVAIDRASLDVVSVQSPDVWFLDTCLHLNVYGMKREEWTHILEETQSVVASAASIHGYWTDDVDTLWLQMGRAPWKSTRIDRFSGSRVWSTVNNDSLNSADRLQLVKISRRLGDPPQEVTATHPDGLIPEWQTMAHFLRMSLRLGPIDNLTVMELLVSRRVN